MFLFPHIVFTSPKNLPKPSLLKGKVVVLDVAFSAKGLRPAFEDMTLPFINELGKRLVLWIDHHDHEYADQYNKDPRFMISSKQKHPACPEMITPEIVQNAGEVNTIVCHLDLDGIYSAAKWINNGIEPYKDSDKHAAIADSRVGVLEDPALTIDYALRARFRNTDLKMQIINYLLNPKKIYWDNIKEAAKEYKILLDNSRMLSLQYKVNNNIAYLKLKGKVPPFDKTELLLLGQKIAKISAVEYSGNLTLAAAFNSGIDFVKILDLGGGMPTRVTLPSKYSDKYLLKLIKYMEEQQ